VRNDRSSHNVATLMAHVALRLPRAWYFSSTDVELTVNAVVLLRQLVRSLISHATADELAAHLSAAPNPGRTRNKDLEAVSFTSFIAACLDFLALSPVTGEQLELHTQVLTLLLALLSTQLCEPDVLSAASLVTGESPLASADPALAAAMAVGIEPAGSLAGQGVASKPAGSASKAPAATAAAATALPAPTPAVPQARAAAVVGALLRNICVDGARDEEGEPAPADDSTATGASRLVDAARGAAYKAAASGAAAAEGAAREVAAWGAAAGSGGGAGGGIVSGVWNAAASVAAFPAHMLLPSIIGAGAEGPGGELPRPLAERSALLLLLLTHNCRSGVDAAVAPLVNPYRHCLCHMTDADNTPKTAPPPAAGGSGAGATPATAAGASAAGEGGAEEGAAASALLFPAGSPRQVSAALSLRFRSLFTALTHLCASPLGTATLYTCLHGCRAFADHVLVRSDIDELLLPLAKQLYFAAALSPEHRYMLIITLLLFSQDAGFCDSAHRTVKVREGAIPWFGDRLLGGEVSLGSLLVILLVRLVTAPPTPAAATSATPKGASAAASATPSSNSVTNDAYLHSNCLAVLANHAPYFQGLHGYAAQRLVAMLHTLHRRYGRALTRLRAAEAAAAGAAAVGSGAEAAASAAAAASSLEAAQGELARYDQGVRVTLEVLHAALQPSHLASNISLLYALLHARSHTLAPVLADADFMGDAVGVGEVAAHFAGVLGEEEARRRGVTAEGPAATAAATDAATGPATAPAAAAPAGPSVVWEESDVEAALLAAVRVWQGGAGAAGAAASLRETKFAYEEDAQPEVFFVPYVWTAALQFTCDVGWHLVEAEAAVPIRLFPLSPAVALYPAVPLPCYAPSAAAAATAAVGSTTPAAAAPAAAAAAPAGVATPVGGEAGAAAGSATA
jgi:hypothetical protein